MTLRLSRHFFGRISLQNPFRRGFVHESREREKERDGEKEREERK